MIKGRYHHSPCIASFVVEEEEEVGPLQKEHDPQDGQGENLTSSPMCCCYDGGKVQRLLWCCSKLALESGTWLLWRPEMLGCSHRWPRLFDPGHTLVSQNLVLKIKHEQSNGCCILQTFQLQCF